MPRIALGSPRSSRSASATTLLHRPINLIPPALSGTPAVGATMTVDVGVWSGDELVYVSQLFVDGVLAATTTGLTFIIGAVPVGSMLYVRVVATNRLGQGVAYSAEVGPVADADLGGDLDLSRDGNISASLV